MAGKRPGTPHERRMTYAESKAGDAYTSPAAGRDEQDHQEGHGILGQPNLGEWGVFSYTRYLDPEK